MGFNCLKARATSRRQFTFYQLDKSLSNFIKARVLSGIHDTKVDFPNRSNIFNCIGAKCKSFV